MARIKLFRRITPRASRPHPTEVECGYAAFDHAGKRYLLLETYGSDDREIPGKVSQSLQLDADSARRLRQVIDESFPDT
jgi:hypothetical protein